MSTLGHYTNCSTVNSTSSSETISKYDTCQHRRLAREADHLPSQSTNNDPMTLTMTQKDQSSSV